MQATTPGTEERINWALGLKALLAALSLASLAAGSGSPLPLYGAVLVAGWAIVKPLRLTSWVLSPGLVRFVGQALARLIAVAGAAFVLSYAINSDLLALSVPGTVMFVALLGAVAVMAARAVWTHVLRWAPRGWQSCGEMLTRVRAQAAFVVGSMAGR